MMKKHLIFTAICGLMLTWGTMALAASAPTSPAPASPAANDAFTRSADDSAAGIPAMPYKAILNQQNGQLFAKALTRLRYVDGRKVIVLPLPRHAANVQLSLPLKDGKVQGRILAWATENVLPFKPQGSVEKHRITYESMHDSLQGALTALEAQHSAILAPLYNMSVADAQSAVEKLRPSLALLGTHMSSTRRDIENARKRAESFGDGVPMSQQLVIEVAADAPEYTEFLVEYSYILPGARWEPVYTFNADTDQNTIDMQLAAKITQNSDLDWHHIQLDLVLGTGNERGLRPVQPWIVRQRGQAEAGYAMDVAPRAQMMLSKNDGADISAPAWDESGNVARWHFKTAPKIAEGENQLVLQNDTWNIPLTRLARPSVSRDTVWLSADYALKGTFMPAGEATFLLDGVMVAQNMFRPAGGRAFLSFGPDPLVTIETKDDSRRSAEEGIISKEQSWTWNWTYVLRNQRPSAVTVRVEEPQTQLEDKAMKVVYADKPAPQKGPESTFVWELPVPAKGTNSIERRVTLTAPKGMNLMLGKP